jgi:hypothetical protein
VDRQLSCWEASLQTLITFENDNSVWRCLQDHDGDQGIDSPLALCDYRTTATTDLWQIDIVYPHFSEEGYEVTFNPAHQWFYKKGMTKDDIALFKLDDNLPTVAKCTCFSIAL